MQAIEPHHIFSIEQHVDEMASRSMLEGREAVMNNCRFIEKYLG